MLTVTRDSAPTPPPPEDLARVRDAIIALVQGSSLETATRDPGDIDAYRSQIAPGSDVFINHLPGESYQRVLPIAARLRRAGFNPVPHLGARNFAGFTQLRDC